MTEAIYLPKTWAELFALPQMRPDPLPRTTMITGTICGEYGMANKDGERPCGIIECRTPHRKGDIVFLPDETLSFIGHKCGAKHFGADWVRAQRKSFRGRRDEQAKQKAIEELRADLVKRIESMPVQETAEIIWARSVLTSFDKFPGGLHDTLENRADQKDYLVVTSRYETDGEVARRRFRTGDTSRDLAPRLTSEEVGQLRGLFAIHPRSRVDHIIDLRMPRLLREARRVLDVPTSTAAELRDIAAEIDAAISDISVSVVQLRNFVDEANLALLPRLGPAAALGIKSVVYIGQGAEPQLIVS